MNKALILSSIKHVGVAPKVIPLDPCTTEESFRSALSEASSRGNADAVRALFDGKRELATRVIRTDGCFSRESTFVTALKVSIEKHFSEVTEILLKVLFALVASSNMSATAGNGFSEVVFMGLLETFLKRDITKTMECQYIKVKSKEASVVIAEAVCKSVESQNEDALKSLLQLFVLENDSWKPRRMPLMHSIHQDVKFTEILCNEKHIDVNALNSHGFSALHLAVYYGKLDHVRALLDCQRVNYILRTEPTQFSTPKLKNRRSPYTPLTLAIEQENLEIFEQLLRKKDNNPLYQNDSGQSKLLDLIDGELLFRLLGVKAGVCSHSDTREAMFIKLLDNYTHLINERYGNAKETFLHVALRTNSLTAIQKLLCYEHLDLSISNRQRQNPMEFASNSDDMYVEKEARSALENHPRVRNQKQCVIM